MRTNGSHNEQVFSNGIVKENFILSVVVYHDGYTRMYNCDFPKVLLLAQCGLWALERGILLWPQWPSVETALTVRSKILPLAYVQAESVSADFACKK